MVTYTQRARDRDIQVTSLSPDPVSEHLAPHWTSVHKESKTKYLDARSRLLQCLNQLKTCHLFHCHSPGISLIYDSGVAVRNCGGRQITQNEHFCTMSPQIDSSKLDLFLCHYIRDARLRLSRNFPEN